MLTEKFLSRSEFEKIIDDTCNDTFEDLFVIFAAAYTIYFAKQSPAIVIIICSTGLISVAPGVRMIYLTIF